MAAMGQGRPSRLPRHRVRYTPDSRRFAATPKSSGPLLLGLDTSGGRGIHRMSMTGRYLRVESRAIAGIHAAPSTLVDLLYPESADYEGRYLDIDKTWHIIHFLLNNHAWEGSGAVFGAALGGTELTDEDLVYGPARYLPPAEVRATAQALKPISFGELWSRLDEARIREAELYWERTPESEAYVRENYQALQAFFLKAASSNEAVILWLA